MGKYTAPVEDHLILPAQVRLPPGHEHRLVGLGSYVPTPAPVAHLNPIAERDVHVNAPLASGETALFWLSLEFPGTRLPAFPAWYIASIHSLPIESWGVDDEALPQRDRNPQGPHGSGSKLGPLRE